MCRMLASVGPRGPAAEELEAFRGLCEGGCGGPHGDGWGMVGYLQPRQPSWVVKSLQPASLDAGYGAAARQAVRFPVVVAHFRKASSGGLSLDHTHPFVEGPWAFAHNGTIRGGYAEKFGPAPGMNDSRAFFARVRAHLARGPAQALGAALREVQEGGFPYTSITALLTDGERLWALRDVRERPEEYAMHWARVGDRTVFCQERILDADWREVPNGHVAVADARGVELLRA